MSGRRRSVGTLFWGLTLLTLGALLLARNLGFTIPIWSALVRYWPVLIIVWGLLKLVDYYRLKGDPDRRTMFSGGEVVMLVLVVLVGSAMTAAANISPSIGRLFNLQADFDFWDITGSTYTYSEHHELAAASGSSLNVFNLYGTVDIRPSDSDKIVLDVEKTVRAANKEEADGMSRDFTFSIKQDGGGYRIVSNRDESFAGQPDVPIGNQRQRFKSSLTIKLPHQTSVNVNNKYGPVSVTGLEGPETISNKYGPTSIRNVSGSITMTTGYGSVIGENVTGAVTISNRYASTTLRNIGGNVDVDSQFGSVDLKDVKGNATIQNRYSVINVQRVAGSVSIQGRNNSVDVDEVGGTLEANNSYKNVSVRNAKGVLKLSNRHGDINIELAQPPIHEITINGDYSDVTLELPAGSAFTLDGQTRYGQIESEFDAISINSSGRDRSAHGQVGRGEPKIVVQTQHGNIRVEKRG